jgi:hypothetical protein
MQDFLERYIERGKTYNVYTRIEITDKLVRCTLIRMDDKEKKIQFNLHVIDGEKPYLGFDKAFSYEHESKMQVLLAMK